MGLLDENAQLACREENAEKRKNFHPLRIFGTVEKVYLDAEIGQMMITSAGDRTSDNPDIIDIEKITDVRTEIEDNKEEIFCTDCEGNEKSYNPPRYKHAYEFHITFRIDSPGLCEIRVDLNNGERPESEEDDLYLEWQMRMQELASLIRQRNLKPFPDLYQFGPDEYVRQLRRKQWGGSFAGMPVPVPEAKPLDAEPVSSDGVWKCPMCGNENKSKFCTECGTVRPRCESPEE